MKRSIVLLFMHFFLYANEVELISASKKLQIYNKTEWKVLLHYNKDLYIQDSSYILSEQFSLENEMVATIKGFFKPSTEYPNINNHPQCKFPARRLFIMHELNITQEVFPTVSCNELSIYEQKAPADSISLIYASENVSNPSSMMGHTFLKYSGYDNNKKKVEHAVTFYTVIESQNPLTLIYQNLFSGMKGIFSLQPYKTTLFQYTENENRNVWEYKLLLSDYQKGLMYYHAWELKDVHMKYFFTSYNCSTIIYFMLALANTQIYDKRSLWITPLETVKFSHQYNLIKEKKLLASNDWIIKMILEHIESNDVDNIKDIINSNKIDKINELDFYSLQLMYAFNEVQHKQNKASQPIYQDIKQSTLEKIDQSSLLFNISEYKDPNKIPDERQFALGYINVDNNEYLKLNFLPASHLLNDDNRQYFGESELKIFNLSALITANSFEINEFTLYGMKSYIPYNSLTHDLSYQLQLGFEKEYSETIKLVDTYKIDGGVGVDFLLGNDINIFAMLNAGLGYSDTNKLHIFLNPQIGFMIYEILEMKSLIYYQPLLVNSEKVYEKYVLNHNLFLSKNKSLYFNFTRVNAMKDGNVLEFGAKFIF